MTQPRNFSVKDELSDVTLLVEGHKLHVNKAYDVACVLQHVHEGFAESKQAEVEVKGPPGEPLKYGQFLELMRVIHPPGQDIKTKSIEYLLELAHYFGMDIVFRHADIFLTDTDSNHQRIPLIKKVVLLDKYADKLAKTKRLVFPAFQNPSMARRLIVRTEYATLSDGMKLKLLQDLVATNYLHKERLIRPIDRFAVTIVELVVLHRCL